MVFWGVHGNNRVVNVYSTTQQGNQLNQSNTPRGTMLYFEVPRWQGTTRTTLCQAQKVADEVLAILDWEEPYLARAICKMARATI